MPSAQGPVAPVPPTTLTGDADERLDTVEQFTREGALPAKVQTALDGRYLLGAPRRVDGLRTDPTFITRFATGHGWTLDTGATGAVTTVTDDTCLSGNAIQLTATAGNNGPALFKSSLAATDLAATIPVVWVKRITTGGALNCYLGDNSLTNYYYWNVTVSETDEWTAVPLLFSKATLIGTLDRSTGVTRIHFTANGGASGANILVGGVGTIPYSAKYPNGVVSITFDDSLISAGKAGRAILDAHGWGATGYLQVETVGTGSGLSLDELHALEEVNGWEIAGHSFTSHTDYTEWSSSELERELFGLRRYLDTNGFRGRDLLAWTYGSSNAAVRDAARRYFAAARTVTGGDSLHPSVISEPMSLKAITWGDASSVASFESTLDDVADQNGWAILVFHTVGGVSGGGNISESDFSDICDHIESLGMAVEPVGKVLGLWGDDDPNGPDVVTSDSNTGRRTIGDQEIGDTGWRLVAKSELGNPANLTGSLYLRRIGNQVYVRQTAVTLGGSWVIGTGSDNVFTLPTGFQSTTFGAVERQPLFRNGSTGATTTASAISGRIEYRDNAAAGNVIGAGMFPSFPTDDAWPSSLPGSAV